MKWLFERRVMWMLAVVVGVLAMGSAAAEAAFVLTIDDLGTAGIDVIVVDEFDGAVGTVTTLGASNSADILGGDGLVGFSGSVGAFVVNVTTGVSKPVIGGGSRARLDLNSVDVSGGAGILEIKLTDTDFVMTYPELQNTFNHLVGGTTDGTIEFYGAADFDNFEFGIGGDGNDVESSLGPYTGAFSFWNMVVFPEGSITGPFSLTTTALITHTGSGLTSFDAEVRIPEPATIVIWSFLGALGVAVTCWRRRKAA